MLFHAVQILWLLAATASAAVVRNGNDCAVAPVSSDSGSDLRKRSLDATMTLNKEGPKLVQLTGNGLAEMYPRPDPAVGRPRPKWVPPRKGVKHPRRSLDEAQAVVDGDLLEHATGDAAVLSVDAPTEAATAVAEATATAADDNTQALDACSTASTSPST